MNKRQRKKWTQKLFHEMDFQAVYEKAFDAALGKAFEQAKEQFIRDQTTTLRWPFTALVATPDEQARLPLPPGKNYCARCGQICGFSEDWKKEHAVIEREAYFGPFPEEEFFPVCEDCWHEVIPVITVSQN